MEVTAVPIAFLAIVLALGIPLLAIALPFILIFGLVWLLKGRPPRRSKEELTQEARTMQQINQGLSRMEERIEALETILIEREERKVTHDTGV